MPLGLGRGPTRSAAAVPSRSRMPRLGSSLRRQSAIAKSRGQKNALVGRRVAVPQEVFGFVDDDGICFNGTIINSDDRRCLIRFKYTGEEELFPLELTRRWLLAEVPVDPLCDLLQTL
ncbi:hypothetical protein AB1Y20_011390 [Prymnesium parvum]|uniref:Uncharacterized protein n=1 Tax=Prymnesium parvum TaxID=97485 RepID=A0AB34IQ03_PRYPA